MYKEETPVWGILYSHVSPGCWWMSDAVASSPWWKPVTDEEVWLCPYVAWKLLLVKDNHWHNTHACGIILQGLVSLCQWCIFNISQTVLSVWMQVSAPLQVQVLSETWEEDLRELLEEVEGVRLWSNLSRASLRLDVFSCDSEPESWLCGPRGQKVF